MLNNNKVYPTIIVQGKNKNLARNVVRTAKYNIFTFIPKFLFFQYKQLTNVYFLVNFIICCIPFLSSVIPITAGVPIAIILIIAATRELLEDAKRHFSDRRTNNTKYTVLQNGVVTQIVSKNICVGMIIKLKKDDVVPADIIPIHSAHKDGVCYFDTAALDGETTLKSSFVPERFVNLQESDLNSFTPILECEYPHPVFNIFKGFFSLSGDKIKTALNEKNMVMRGSVMRRTDYLYGVVCYTGKNTKQAMNSSIPQNKNSGLNVKLNYLVIAAIIFQLTLCTIMASFSTWRHGIVTTENGFWYLNKEGYTLSQPVYFIKKFFGFFNATINMVPISLASSIEITRYLQGIFIEKDDDFKVCKKDQEGKEIVVGMKTNCSVLIEEMGEVEFVLSDKTGTLTENQMRFLKCSVGGKVYNTKDGIIDVKQSYQHDKGIEELFTCLALCNSCSVETQNDKKSFCSLSPDEEALCESASLNGVDLISRTQNEITITRNGTIEKYTIIVTIEFNSLRKMMSILLENDNKYILYTKGADSAIENLLSEESNQIKVTTRNHADAFGQIGLRTLFVAKRELSQNFVEEWLLRFKAIDPLATDIKEQQRKMYMELECNLTLIGATAIEDQLQKKVPETISLLKNAGLKVWIITGDKMETAVSISRSCNLFTSTQELIYFSHESESEFVSHLSIENSRLEHLEKHDDTQIGVVIYEKNIDWFINHKKDFKKLAEFSSSVVCCRASPKQKSEIAIALKEMTNKKCLTIGDGMNDIPMITKGDVGVGIYGKEGNQAAVSADFSIHQFHHLGKLVLFYGKNGKYQISTLIKFCFYKNAAFFLVNMFYAFISNFTVQLLHDDWIITCTNTFFTTLPPITIALFDYDLTWDEIKKYPQSHKESLVDKNYSLFAYIEWFVYGVIQAGIFFSLFYFVINGTDVTFYGKVNGFTFTSVSLTTCSLCSIWVTLFIYTKRLNIYVFAAFIISVILYAVVYTAVMFIPNMSKMGISSYGWIVVLQQPTFYLLLIVAVSFASLPQVVTHYVQRTLHPSNYQIIQENTILCNTKSFTFKEIELDDINTKHDNSASFDNE
ncbi:phospholipid-transporting ATPase, putative [Entamoeba invadens IP1]|uniref:Phospholipid-transporting ATPase n=1 Tax=Entamoeba invadens IP1 TaxID=370355 RepID=A0A0A1UFQ1_ENTIV|nr:phospholipid-transporting ATPase, putative [Entamoeba invadens IP1]ELP91839.1 phospholipid-transporting ATPase, putative [Entamoeba invadens IP1]|eukprot:XP_004258610.1 phospholipid-transporting ATPase, putative [Entamoeba invadens IP1]